MATGRTSASLEKPENAWGGRKAKHIEQKQSHRESRQRERCLNGTSREGAQGVLYIFTEIDSNHDSFKTLTIGMINDGLPETGPHRFLTYSWRDQNQFPVQFCRQAPCNPMLSDIQISPYPYHSLCQTHCFARWCSRPNLMKPPASPE